MALTTLSLEPEEATLIEAPAIMRAAEDWPTAGYVDDHTVRRWRCVWSTATQGDVEYLRYIFAELGGLASEFLWQPPYEAAALRSTFATAPQVSYASGSTRRITIEIEEL